MGAAEATGPTTVPEGKDENNRRHPGEEVMLKWFVGPIAFCGGLMTYHFAQAMPKGQEWPLIVTIILPAAMWAVDVITRGE
jgi:hypothetical protein